MAKIEDRTATACVFVHRRRIT